jgi:F-box/WD-40 domain protein 7
MEIMVDPVILATGMSYDRLSIQKWLDQGHKTCPVTGMRLRHTELTPNFALRSAILDWAAINNITLSQRPAPQPAQPVFTWEESRGEGNILQGHDEIIWAIQISGNTFYTASADKTVRAWDITSRRCLGVMEHHTRPVLSLAISDNKIFSGSYDFSINVSWSSPPFRKIAKLTGHTDAVRSMVVAETSAATATITQEPKSRLFSASYDGTLRVWDTCTLECLAVLKGHTGPVRTLVKCGNKVFSGSYDKTVRVWDVDTLKCLGVLTGHKGAVRALASTPETHTVFSGSDDSTIRAWDTETLTCKAVLTGHEDNVRVLATGHGGKLFSGSWDKTIRVWDGVGMGMNCIAVLEGHEEAVLALAVGENFIVSGSYDTSLRFWDVATWRCVRKCEGHDDAVRVLAADNGVVFSGSYDGSVGIW